MGASHLVAGENIKNGKDEAADAGGCQNDIEHGWPSERMGTENLMFELYTHPLLVPLM
jgi:hypothetical protein